MVTHSSILALAMNSSSLQQRYQGPKLRTVVVESSGVDGRGETNSNLELTFEVGGWWSFSVCFL